MGRPDDFTGSSGLPQPLQFICNLCNYQQILSRYESRSPIYTKRVQPLVGDFPRSTLSASGKSFDPLSADTREGVGS